MPHFNCETSSALGFYVYRLIDPRNGNTFYIGKGKDNRLFDHVHDALNFDTDKYDDEMSAKMTTIREILSKGLQVIHIIQRWGLSEKEAKEVEAALIDAMPGLDNAIRGYDTDRGATSAIEIIDRFHTEKFAMSAATEKFVVIKIKQENHNNLGNYEATRYAWKL